MQDCFRKYPEVYGSELSDDEDEQPAPAQEGAEAAAKTAEAAAQPAKKEEAVPESTASTKGKSQ